VIALRSVSKVFGIPHARRGTLLDRLTGRRFDYESLHALRDVTLEVRAGESVGLLGRNGSGKTTLLRIIAGIYPPTTGTVRVAGAVAPLVELGVGFQGRLPVRDNVDLYGILLGIPRARLAREKEGILEAAGVARFADTALDALSTGLRMRLAYTVAMRSDAPVLILDEALSVGDAAFQQRSREELARMRAAGRTVLIVSHAPEEFRTLCDRVIVLDAGRVHAQGPPGEMIDAYRALLAA
jgi:lipopolysaccharide transport system ATP-binding protein